MTVSIIVARFSAKMKAIIINDKNIYYSNHSLQGSSWCQEYFVWLVFLNHKCENLKFWEKQNV